MAGNQSVFRIYCLCCKNHSLQDKQGAEYDGRRRGSLINFMLALHSTSVRAKDALQNFRKRTEASNARRKEQLAELDKLSEGSHRSANSDEDDVPHDDPGDPFDSESPASSHVETEEDREESCGAEDGENDDQVVSDENGNEAAEDIGLSKRWGIVCSQPSILSLEFRGHIERIARDLDATILVKISWNAAL